MLAVVQNIHIASANRLDHCQHHMRRHLAARNIRHKMLVFVRFQHSGKLRHIIKCLKGRFVLFIQKLHNMIAINQKFVSFFLTQIKHCAHFIGKTHIKNRIIQQFFRQIIIQNFNCAQAARPIQKLLGNFRIFHEKPHFEILIAAFVCRRIHIANIDRQIMQYFQYRQHRPRHIAERKLHHHDFILAGGALQIAYPKKLSFHLFKCLFFCLCI